MDPVLIVFLVVVAAGIAGAWWSRTRYATVSLGVNLRSGEKYAESFDNIVARSDFGSPDARAGVVRRIASLIQPEDVVDGFVHVRSPWSGRDEAGIRAEALSRKN